MANIEKFRGAMLGEVCGDALGYPLVTLNTGKIIRHYGPFGLRTMVKPKDKNAKALISDNSQMMLAAIDGLLWGDAKKLQSRKQSQRKSQSVLRSRKVKHRVLSV